MPQELLLFSASAFTWARVLGLGACIAAAEGLQP